VLARFANEHRNANTTPHAHHRGGARSEIGIEDLDEGCFRHAHHLPPCFANDVPNEFPWRFLARLREVRTACMRAQSERSVQRACGAIARATRGTCVAVAVLMSSVFAARRVVVTGGPGAGKTAILELARRHFCSHVAVLREAASIIFGGGFPRRPDELARAAAQRAIYHVQDELERVALGTPETHVVLCDRGTLDGLAYWPGPDASFFDGLHTSLAAELARYDVVIHLHTPTRRDGYHGSSIRIEHSWEAEALDARLVEVWKDHPHRIVIPSDHDFMKKATRTLDVIRELLPSDCRDR
jgi:predicted ATPase